MHQCIFFSGLPFPHHAAGCVLAPVAVVVIVEEYGKPNIHATADNRCSGEEEEDQSFLDLNLGPPWDRRRCNQRDSKAIHDNDGIGQRKEWNETTLTNDQRRRRRNIYNQSWDPIGSRLRRRHSDPRRIIIIVMAWATANGSSRRPTDGRNFSPRPNGFIPPPPPRLVRRRR
jgi:hypothetical protein